MERIRYLFDLCLEVLKDWRVIAVTIFLILFLTLVNYIVNYQKKAKVYRVKKSKATTETEKKPAGESEKTEAKK